MWGAFCPAGIEAAAKMAKAFDCVLDMKAKAGEGHEGYVYACPEIALHGEAYALTAQLMMVNGSQEMLF
jgi:hypothetical protein